jgi:K+/H+ antiporter YhaU regulatory subunit KhtT
MQEKHDEVEKDRKRILMDASKGAKELEKMRIEVTGLKEENTRLLKRVEELGREVRDLKLQQ